MLFRLVIRDVSVAAYETRLVVLFTLLAGDGRRIAIFEGDKAAVQTETSFLLRFNNVI
jgi:hypothetical protein